MKEFKVIKQLELLEGVLMCKKPSGRSWQNAHFRQGDLDGACGVYSTAMVLNILGVFIADEFNLSPDEVDNRYGKYRLINAFNKRGLYRNGLFAEEIKEILTSTFSKEIKVETLNKKEIDIQEHIISYLDKNIPIILGIDYNKVDGHWVVVIGYEIEEKKIKSLLILDPNIDSPTQCLWNGKLCLEKIPRKTYGYCYNSANNLVDISDIIIIQKQR